MESWRGMIEVLEERFAADSRQRFFSLLRLITQEVDSSAPHSEEVSFHVRIFLVN